MTTTKGEILAAIKRLAAANGGRPVGRERFTSATGIKESAWRGRYWVRWGDALIEAGFEPNSWQEATDSDDDLVRHLARLAQGLGHYPVNAERRMHRAGNPDFPTPNTFDTRLGSRQRQLTMLLDLALQDPDFADVREMVEPLITGPTPQGTGGPAPMITGSVYLMKSGQHFKIGRSNHVGRRTYELTIQLPERIEVVHEIKTDDPEGIEHYWHRRFAAKRANGEWFALDAADVAAFKRRTHFM